MAAFSVFAAIAADAADAPRPSVALSYTRDLGAEACPDEGTLRDGVAARLGYDPFDAKAKGKVRARIWRSSGSLRATIDVLDENGAVKGSRELTSAKNDCEELASAMTLTISMVIDPLGKAPTLVSASASASASASSSAVPFTTSSTSANAGTSSTVEPPPPPPSSTVDRPPPAPPAKGDEPARRFRVSAGGLGSLGVAPRMGGGFSAGIGIDFTTWSVDLEGRRDLPVTAALGRGTATTSLVTASVVPCLHRSVIAVCGVVSAGSLQASGGGVDQPTARSSLFLGAGVRAGVEWAALDTLAFYARFEVISPLIHATIRLDGDDVWSTPPVAGSLGGGLVAFF